MSQVNFSVNREYFSTTNQQRLTVPVAISKNTPIQKKGSLIFDPIDNVLYCSTGTAWTVIPSGTVVVSVNSGAGIDVDNTDPENPVVNLSVIPDGSILGNNTGGATTPQDLSGTQVTAMLDSFTSGLKGLAPASGGGTVNYLRADGTWSVPSGTYTPPAVNNNTIMGNNTGGSAAPIALTGTQATALLDTFSTSSTTKGLVNGSNSVGTSYFLRADNTWAVPSGGADSGQCTVQHSSVTEGSTEFRVMDDNTGTITLTMNGTRSVSRQWTLSSNITGARPTFNTTTGTTSSPGFIATATSSSGSINFNIGYCSNVGSSTFTSLSTGSLSFALGLEALTTAPITWSVNPVTVPAFCNLVCAITNNLNMSGAGLITCRVIAG